MLAIALFAGFSAAQGRTNRLTRPCPATTTPAKVDVQKDGNIDLVPCPGKSVRVNGTAISSSLPQNTASLANYASLSAAVAAIGSVAKTELQISGDTTVAANLTVTGNIALTMLGTSIITVNSGVTLTIANGADFKADVRQVFAGTGTVKFTGSKPKDIYPEWFGAVGDGTTDDLAAFNKIIATSDHVAYNPTGALHIVLSSGKNYWLSDKWEIDVPVMVESFGGDNWSNAGKMTFAANKTGIVIHHLSTKTGVNDNRAASFSQLKNFALAGTAGSATHTVNTSGLTLTKTAGADFTDGGGYHVGNTVTMNGFDYVMDGNPGSATTVNIKKPRVLGFAVVGTPYVGVADYNSWPSAGEWVGQQINIGGTNYTISALTTNVSILGRIISWITLSANYTASSNGTAGGSSSTFSAVNFGTDTATTVAPHLYETGAKVQVLNGGTLPPELVNNEYYYVIKVDGSNLKFATTYANAIALTAIDLTGTTSGTHTLIGATYYNTFEIQSLAPLTAQPARFNLFHGIDVRGQARIEGVEVRNFAGNGINADSSLLPTALPGTAPNSNNSLFVRNSTYFNYGSGIYTRGVNSNQLTISNNDSSTNHGAGIMELSFLGNIFIANHTSFNYFAATYAESPTNASSFIGEYSEGGQPSSYHDQYNFLLPGIYGAGFDAASKHGQITQGISGRVEASGIYSTATASSPKIVAATIGRVGGINGQQNAVLAFGAAEDVNNLTGGGSAASVEQFAYQLGYNQLATGMYALYYGGQYTDMSKTVLGFSGKLAADGGGHLYFPRGFRTAIGDPLITKVLRGTFTVDPASIGAATFSSQTFTLTGATVGDNLTVNVPAAGLTSGIMVGQATVSAANTVTVAFYNFTGGAIDLASASWSYSIIR